MSPILLGLAVMCWSAAAAPLGPQQFRGELDQFPGDIKRAR
jgi:hypothetical protein